MNFQKLVKQAQQMQEKMKRELESLVVEAGVGGGMVSVKMNGNKQLLSATVDPEVLDPGDPGMLADLLVAAVNEAGRKVDEETQKRLGGMAGMIPGM